LDRQSDLEARIGYRFRDGALLEQALTHRSYGSPHNERLEFLGDSVLGCVMAEALYARFPGLSEGELTRLRAALVCEEALCDAARELQVGPGIRLGEGERARGSEIRASILADALEALFGAVLMDGGYDAARRIVLAVPVAAPDSAERLARLADEVVCLSTPADFRAVSLWYRSFGQTSDEEVIELLQRASAPAPAVA